MLYIMRHGKTDWNARRKLQGRTDIPLNAEGREMAAQAGVEYQNVHLDVCYCSPLVRAKETAELFLKGRDVPIIYDERIAEMGFGIYEGLANSFDIPDCPINPLFWDPEHYVPVEGGESLAELYARTGEFLDQVVRPALAEGKDIVIVGHGAMNSAIICQVKGIPVKDFWSTGLDQCKLLQL